MPQLIDPEDLLYCATESDASAADWRSEQRERLTLSLDEIASEVTTALQKAGLAIPVFLTVPSSGDALLTFATPLDPSDADWSQAGKIVSDIVGDKIDGVKLRHRELPCAAAGVVMSAADLCVGSDGIGKLKV